MSGSVVKVGWLTKYSKGILGEKWKKVHVVLNSDSSFCWYKDKGNPTPKGNIYLKNMCKFLTCGSNIRTIPHSPNVPSWASLDNMIAFPEQPSKKSAIYFFLCNDQAEFHSWMTAIVSTLPSAPVVTSSNQIIPSQQANFQPGATFPQACQPPLGPPVYPSTSGNIGFESLSMTLPQYGQPCATYNNPSGSYPPRLPVHYPSSVNYSLTQNIPTQSFVPAGNMQNYPQQYPVQNYNAQFYPQQNYGMQPNTMTNFQQPGTAATNIVYQKSPKKNKGTGKMLAGIAGGAVAGYAASKVFRPFGGFGWGHGSWGSGSWGSFSGGSFGSFGGCD